MGTQQRTLPRPLYQLTRKECQIWFVHADVFPFLHPVVMVMNLKIIAHPVLSTYLFPAHKFQFYMCAFGWDSACKFLAMVQLFKG